MRIDSLNRESLKPYLPVPLGVSRVIVAVFLLYVAIRLFFVKEDILLSAIAAFCMWCIFPVKLWGEIGRRNIRGYNLWLYLKERSPAQSTLVSNVLPCGEYPSGSTGSTVAMSPLVLRIPLLWRLEGVVAGSIIRHKHALAFRFLPFKGWSAKLDSSSAQIRLQDPFGNSVKNGAEETIALLQILLSKSLIGCGLTEALTILWRTEAGLGRDGGQEIARLRDERDWYEGSLTFALEALAAVWFRLQDRSRLGRSQVAGEIRSWIEERVSTIATTMTPLDYRIRKVLSQSGIRGFVPSMERASRAKPTHRG